jgi:hypothetical protein
MRRRCHCCRERSGRRLAVERRPANDVDTLVETGITGGRLGGADDADIAVRIGERDAFAGHDLPSRPRRERDVEVNAAV